MWVKPFPTEMARLLKLYITAIGPSFGLDQMLKHLLERTNSGTRVKFLDSKLGPVDRRHSIEDSVD